MDLFPSGIAEGAAFCNRVHEREALSHHVKSLTHTILLAPRRYGKTSLIRQVISENNFIHEWIDCLPIATHAQLEARISNAVQALLIKLSPQLIKLSKKTTQLIKSISPELNLSALGQSLTLQLVSNQKIGIDQLLLKLDDYATKTGKKAVLVFDEFQQVSELPDHHSVEALIRHAIERSKSITYLFSGSNRHLLQEMFSKSARPMYRLCQSMLIERIAASEYEAFINLAAKKHWKQALPQDSMQALIALTECHPFYVNGLCRELWELKKAPKKEDILLCWRGYIEKNKGIIISDMISLPLNQRKVLQALAEAPTKEPFAHVFCSKVALPAGSVRRATEYLIKKDMVYIDTQQAYRILDPAVRYYLLEQARKMGG